MKIEQNSSRRKDLISIFRKPKLFQRNLTSGFSAVDVVDCNRIGSRSSKIETEEEEEEEGEEEKAEGREVEPDILKQECLMCSVLLKRRRKKALKRSNNTRKGIEEKRLCQNFLLQQEDDKEITKGYQQAKFMTGIDNPTSSICQRMISVDGKVEEDIDLDVPPDYLVRHFNGNYKKAQKHYLTNLKWRDSYQIEYILTQKPKFYDYIHQFLFTKFLGRAKNGKEMVSIEWHKPVDYGHCKKIGLEPSDLSRVLFFRCEYVNQVLNHDFWQRQENGVITIFDGACADWGAVWKPAIIPFAHHLVKSYQAYYPCRRKLNIVINAPPLMKKVWPIMKRLIPQNLLKTIVIVETKEEFQKLITEYIDLDQIPIDFWGSRPCSRHDIGIEEEIFEKEVNDDSYCKDNLKDKNVEMGTDFTKDERGKIKNKAQSIAAAKLSNAIKYEYDTEKKYRALIQHLTENEKRQRQQETSIKEAKTNVLTLTGRPIVDGQPCLVFDKLDSIKQQTLKRKEGERGLYYTNNNHYVNNKIIIANANANANEKNKDLRIEDIVEEKTGKVRIDSISSFHSTTTDTDTTTGTDTTSATLPPTIYQRLTTFTNANTTDTDTTSVPTVYQRLTTLVKDTRASAVSSGKDVYTYVQNNIHGMMVQSGAKEDETFF